MTYISLTEKGIEINQDIIFLFEEFETLWARDRTEDKRIAKEELKYIFILCDYRSPGLRRALSGIELQEYAKSVCNLPESWEEDEVINMAVLRYIRETDGVKRKMYKSLVLSLGTALYAVNTLDEKLQEMLQLFNNAETNEETNNLIRAVQSSVSSILTYGNEIPKKMEMLDKVMKQADREESKAPVGRAGIAIRKSMLPHAPKFE